MFISDTGLNQLTWQAFERAIGRLLMYEGFSGIRLVGQSHDQGADIIAHKAGKRWLFQVKHWKKRVGLEVVDRTLEALRIYRAQVPVIVALNGFEDSVWQHQQALMSRGTPLQLWDRKELIKRVARLVPATKGHHMRDYQEDAIKSVLHAYLSGHARKAMVVMATGLGKTYTAAETLRRINALSPKRVLVIAHTNELVLQLERAFWPFLSPIQETLVWNGYERVVYDDMKRVSFVFACLNSIAEYIDQGKDLPPFDFVAIDECHHVGGAMYEAVLQATEAGQAHGPFLLGLTATPWRPDEVRLEDYFGEPLISIDIVTGLKRGFLTNIDYRMYTDNIKWEALAELGKGALSPRSINRTLFISEWDDAVVHELKAAWKEQARPRAIVFCGTIDHAITMRDRINALGFCNAAAIYSQTAWGRTLSPWERNKILCDFHDGTVDVVCAVDIFNEGVDVPDVNIIVFQRVTHSRRIFIQQLGRGLRLAPDKEKVIVLDFVSDIRRFAAGLDLKEKLREDEALPSGRMVRVRLPHKVSFRRLGQEDKVAETFLRQWLEDVAAIEAAGEDSSILKFPPVLPGGRS